MFKTIYLYILIIASFISFNANALTLDDAKSLYIKGKYAEALPTFKKQLARTPKDAALNQWTGVCLYETGHTNEAIQYLEYADSKSITEASRYLATISFYQYKFEDAQYYINRYIEALSSANSPIPNEISLLSSQITNAANMLSRVEKIQVIDSLTVDKNNFFKYYKLSRESGTITSTSTLPKNFSSHKPSIVFRPESQNQMVWAMNDKNGKATLMLSSILSDGTWEAPHALGTNLNDNGNANYPYIMPDGITVYYANDGDNSIGGYDIFFSRKNENGYLQPQNLGMPYNSIYNDYMYVIDEITGIGWWATDRNNIEGKVTIYLFIPNNVRLNYSADTPNLINLAKLTSIKDTWGEHTNFNHILNNLEKLSTDDIKSNDVRFSLTLPNGDVYTTLSDFDNTEAAIAMQEYLDALANIKSKKEYLEKLRISYQRKNDNVKQEIIETEKSILTEQDNLIRLKNIVISIESKKH